MVTLSATVCNEFGIHCRPSSIIAREALEYSGSITVRSDGGEANAKSILELVGLAVGRGQRVRISVSGPDEDAVARHFAALFAQHFDFAR
jgi:phosphotransferase system HPr (HPr) family protein